ncbi:MAG: 50S ribosomal protein L5 [Methanococcoides sp.]|jgi:large subunit ribosomal protein L5|uniref:Large ribosomal subunit protein uL5 n=2 Tax=Methanococcoides TaxID=2225 RepID=A0A9E4ZCJ9_9EURY|nr:50S ribosomal protein L5 [Methanococcoides seepicolus]MCM1985830.1 50S ribosomal protein L5 [Methanococcoides seepicolus]NOQ48787.1 50S ribosomal protein L5 [Methanococcoides sp.]
MRNPKVEKVVVHMGVGESGQHLVDAESILETVTGQTVVRSYAKRTLPAFTIKKGEPIGCKVTLRGEAAESFLETSLGIVERKIDESQFDIFGNVSFGVEEHTDYPGMRYDPNIGIFGMDIAVIVNRPGYRVSKRRIAKRKIPTSHKITKEDTISFFKDKYAVEVE